MGRWPAPSRAHPRGQQRARARARSTAKASVAAGERKEGKKQSWHLGVL
jgi:hypothetical protein